MFTLDFIRPVGQKLNRSDVPRSIANRFFIGSEIYGSPNHYYYFKNNENFIKILHKKYFDYFEKILSLEAKFNKFTFATHKFDQYVGFELPYYLSGKPENNVLHLSGMPSRISKFLNSYFNKYELMKLLHENEAKFQNVLENYASEIAELLGISSVDSQLNFYADNCLNVCHNDFHPGNLGASREGKIVVFDFEMSLLHRSTFQIELTNFKRFDSRMRVQSTSDINATRRFLVVKNLAILLYIRDFRGWLDSNELKKFIRIFH